MEQIFDCLAVWMASATCFTSEEAWVARYGDGKSSVHLQTFPKLPDIWKNDALAEKYAKIREIRRTVTGAMEVARNEKQIGSSLQAHPLVYVGKEQAALVKSVDFNEICISSALSVKEDAPPASVFTLPDVPGVAVQVKLAEGMKCERCWQVLPEVGSKKDHPDLCNRCHDAVTHMKKAAA
jgi:isoleucyl-tRNA synthetase